MVQEVAEQNLRGCTTLIQVRKVAELDWRDFPTNLPTFVPTFVLGNIYKWLICICILIDFERFARSNFSQDSLVSSAPSWAQLVVGVVCVPSKPHRTCGPQSILFSSRADDEYFVRLV